MTVCAATRLPSSPPSRPVGCTISRRAFPAMFDALAGQVYGEAMTFLNIEEKLQQLDYLEGYRPDGNSHYIRTRKEVVILANNRVVPAWVYIYPEARLPEIVKNGTLIENGNWIEWSVMKHTSMVVLLPEDTE